MKSTKYKKHYMSKWKFPTRRVGDQNVIGYKAAQKALEAELKRPLHKNTKILTRGGCWVFQEPIEGKSK